VVSDPARVTEARRDHLALAMDFIDNFQEYRENEIVPRVLHHLQRWADGCQPADDWFADPLYGRLPRHLQVVRGPGALSRLRFSTTDVAMLREAIWMRDLARQLSTRLPSEPDWQDWLSELESRLPPTELQDLATVLNIFDWVVRNIQAEPIEWASGQTGDAADGPRGVAGRLAWEALLLGRGDANVRAWIMILMARQARIPVVALGVDDDGQIRPWVTAALVGQDLYLFDTALGLPVPGPKNRGVATLAQVIDNPQLLLQLSAGAEQAEQPSPDDLNRIVALVEATPPYLSQRMHLVERSLPREQDLVLTCAPTALKQRLTECRGVSRVELWTVPYEIVQARQALRTNVEALRELDVEMRPLLSTTPLARGRRQHFRGVYPDNPPAKGAKSYYMDCRISERNLARLDQSPQLRQWMGMGKDESIDPAALQALVETLRQAKQSAGYWLGILAFEQEKYQVAADYFQKRTLDAFPNGTWQQGATYNLARAYERQGQLGKDIRALEKARDLYRAQDDSPQALGNRIRAARITALIDQAPAPSGD
jgi:tetratricopeptide (TPR) repeat protein